MRTQSSINGQGLKLGSQLTCIVGLVFPTKGGSLPSDPMTPLSSHKLLLFISKLLPLLVVVALSLSSSLYFLPRISNPFLFTHFPYLYLEVGGGFMIAFWSYSCVWGPIWLFLTRDKLYRNRDDGIGTGSCLQKITRQWYSPRHRVAKDMGCSGQTHPRLSHTWPVWASLSHIQNEMDLLRGLGPILVFENVWPKAQWAWDHTPYSHISKNK